MSCEILGETPCEKQDNGNNKKSKRNNWEINVEVTRTTVWTEAGPDSVSSCVRDLSLALCALFLNITWQAVWQEQCNFTMPVCSHPSQCVYRERNRKCVCVLLNMSHALMSRGMLARYVKRYKQGKLFIMNMHISNSTRQQSLILKHDLLINIQRKKTRQILQNPNEAAAIVNRAGWVKELRGAFQPRYPHSKTRKHPPNKKTTQSKLWHKTNEPL